MPHLLPILALVLNAFVWGVSWWPFRQLHAAGLHPLWATALMYALALACLLLARPQALRSAQQHPALWLLALSSALTNVAFNWAVTVGDVVRVVLLFYLMPAWSVLLAWKMLGERPTGMALVRLLLAFAGIALVLVPADATWTGWRPASRAPTCWPWRAAFALHSPTSRCGSCTRCPAMRACWPCLAVAPCWPASVPRWGWRQGPCLLRPPWHRPGSLWPWRCRWPFC
jgi:uncharacterized membrane protein